MLLGRGRGHWHNSEQLLDDAAHLADNVALHRQNLLHCEEELNVAEGPQRTLAESQIVTAKANLQMHQGLLPLRQQYYFMRQMAKTLWHSPFSRLQACSWPTKALADVLEADIAALRVLRRALQARHPLHKRHLAIVSASKPLSIFGDVNQGLWMELNQAIDFPTGGATAALSNAFKTFQAKTRDLNITRNDAGQICTAIGPGTQRKYDALSHHITVYGSSTMALALMCRRETGPILGRRSNKRVATRQEQLLDSDKFQLSSDLGRIQGLYHNGFMPVFLRHLNLMSPTEVERRGKTVRWYWHRYWQLRKEHDQRLKKIYQFRADTRKAWNPYRAEKKRLMKKTGERLPVHRAKELLRHAEARFYGKKNKG